MDVPEHEPGPQPQHPLVAALAKHYASKGVGHSADVILCSMIDEQRVPAARFVLCMLSSFFDDLLTNTDLEGGQPREIRVPVEGLTLTRAVEFCYTGDTEVFRHAADEESVTNGGEAVKAAATSVVKLAMAGDYFNIPSLTERSCDVGKAMLKVNKHLAIPMIEIIRSSSHSNTVLTELISAIKATICSDINATLLSEGSFQELSPGTLANVLSNPMSNPVMAGHQEAIFRELIPWAAVVKAPLPDSEQLCSGEADALSRHEEAVQIIVTCVRLERMSPSFLVDVVKPSGLVSKEAMLEAFQKQALEAERRHLLDFTAVPNDISHELKIEEFSIREKKFMLQPSYNSQRTSSQRVPEILKTESIFLRSGDKWGEVKAAMYHNRNSEPELGLVITHLANTHDSLKANQELVTMNIVSATTGKQITKACRPSHGATALLCGLDVLINGGYLVNDCLTIKLSVFTTFSR